MGIFFGKKSKSGWKEEEEFPPPFKKSILPNLIIWSVIAVMSIKTINMLPRIVFVIGGYCVVGVALLYGIGKLSKYRIEKFVDNYDKNEEELKK